MSHDAHPPDTAVQASRRAGSNALRARPRALLLSGLILIAASAPPAADAAQAAQCGSHTGLPASVAVAMQLASGKSVEVLDHETGKTFQITTVPAGKAQSVAKVKEELEVQGPSELDLHFLTSPRE